MNKDIIKTMATSEIVEELKQRKGVYIFNTGIDDRYTIKTEIINGIEEDKITTTRENTGYCTILEIID